MPRVKVSLADLLNACRYVAYFFTVHFDTLSLAVILENIYRSHPLRARRAQTQYYLLPNGVQQKNLAQPALLSLQVGEEQIIIEVRPSFLTIDDGHKSNKWMEPRHWNELYGILLESANAHIKSSEKYYDPRKAQSLLLNVVYVLRSSYLLYTTYLYLIYLLNILSIALVVNFLYLRLIELHGMWLIYIFIQKYLTFLEKSISHILIPTFNVVCNGIFVVFLSKFVCKSGKLH